MYIYCLFHLLITINIFIPCKLGVMDKVKYNMVCKSSFKLLKEEFFSKKR